MNRLTKLMFDKEYRFGMYVRFGITNHMDDRRFIEKQFERRMGYKPDLDDPRSFNEKLQWLKLYDRDSRYTMMVDKYEAKRYIGDLAGSEFVVPTLGVWDTFDEINFDDLPARFVLKCTHDSGGLVVCRDKGSLDMGAAKRKISRSLKSNYFYHSREWPYKDVKPRVIAERYLEESEPGLTDYKFFFFNGEPKFLYISVGMENHGTSKMSFYDLKGVEQPFYRSDYAQYHDAVLPANFDGMVELAKTISDDVRAPFVRIDLYSIDGCIYFSEITFSPCGGMIPFEPAGVDLELGRQLLLPEASRLS